VSAGGTVTFPERAVWKEGLQFLSAIAQRTRFLFRGKATLVFHLVQSNCKADDGVTEPEAGFITQSHIFPTLAESAVHQALLEHLSCLKHRFESGTDSYYKFC